MIHRCIYLFGKKVMKKGYNALTLKLTQQFLWVSRKNNAQITFKLEIMPFAYVKSGSVGLSQFLILYYFLLLLLLNKFSHYSYDRKTTFRFYTSK